jgi:hypothetical protein
MPEATDDSSQQPRVRLLQEEASAKRVRVAENTPPTVEQLRKDAEAFLQVIRDPSKIVREDERFRYHELGFEIDKATNYLTSISAVRFAEQLGIPAAIYVSYLHARLVLGTPYQGRTGWEVSVWDPMRHAAQIISLPQYRFSTPERPIDISLMASGIWSNQSATTEIATGEYDLMQFMIDPQLRPYAVPLLETHITPLQRDAENCVPLCLFTAARLNALRPKHEKLKAEGVQKFSEIFNGVRIPTRESLIPH